MRMDSVDGFLRLRSYSGLRIHEEDSERIRAFRKTTFAKCFRCAASDLNVVILDGVG